MLFKTVGIVLEDQHSQLHERMRCWAGREPYRQGPKVSTVSH